MDWSQAQAGLGSDSFPAENLFSRTSDQEKPVKPACFRQVLLTCPKIPV